MYMKTPSIRTPVKREGAERYILLSLTSFALSVILTRIFLQLTGYPKIGTGTLHIAHVLWGGLLLFIAALLPLILGNRWVLNLSAILSGVGVGLFIDEVGKFITQTNDYFYQPAAPIIYAFFLLTVLLYLNIRKPGNEDPRGSMYRVLEDLTEALDHDLDPGERALLENKLRSAAEDSNDPNIDELVNALLKYLSNKQLRLTRKRPTFFQTLVGDFSSFFDRWLDRPRLRILLSILLGVMGVLAFFDFARLLITTPAPGPAVESLLAPQLLHGELHDAQQALWYIIRTMLEGITGIALIVSGGLMIAGRDRRGSQIGSLALITWIAAINLLVFYFDQFGAVALTFFQFGLLALLSHYRRIFLKL
jgi:hypothetical protein